MSHIYVVGFGDTGRIKVGWSEKSPQRRVEAHKRGARAYLECEQFEEWISPDHMEGVDNERALIAWCRDRSATQVGEYFTLPYSEVLAYAQSLPMTPPSLESDAEDAPSSLSWGAAMAEFAHGWAAHEAIKEALGEDVATLLEFHLNPSCDLPPRAARPGGVDPEVLNQLRKGQREIGLGVSMLDVLAGIAINKILIATAARTLQARGQGREDLIRDLGATA